MTTGAPADGPRRVMVTGAAGFIGRPAVRALVDRGFEVHAVTSRMIAPEAAAEATWHRADLMDPADVRRVIDAVGPSHLLHLAWETTHGAFWESPENLMWVAASLGLAKAFVERGGTRMVVTGTCAEYRWDGTPCREGVTPLEPATLYGTAKHATHTLLDAYARTCGVECAWARIFHLYGAGEPPTRLVPSVVLNLLAGEPVATGPGDLVRDLLFVDDVGSALACIVDSDALGAINVASGTPVSIREVAMSLGEMIGRPDLLRIGVRPASDSEPRVLVADVRRLRDEVGWSPAHDLQRGLRMTVDALREVAA